MNRDNNETLTALHRFWEWNADWMTCRWCKRNLIASRDGEPMVHEPDCKYSNQQHPWTKLRAILNAPETAAATTCNHPEGSRSLTNRCLICDTQVVDAETKANRPPLGKEYEGRDHRGITSDWHYTCTDNDCWCWGSEHHNPRELTRDEAATLDRALARSVRRIEPPLVQGLKSLSFRLCGKGVDLIASFDTIEHAQAARSNFTAWATRPAGETKGSRE